MTNNSTRDSRLELLRIISMLMIMSSHCVECTLGTSNGKFAFLQEPLSLSYVASYIIIMLGNVGTSLFILLTCWFSVGKFGFKTERLLRTVWQTWITCLLCLLIGVVFQMSSVSAPVAIKELFTPLQGQYWYVTSFALFLLILPLLQYLLIKLDNRKLSVLCIILLIACPIYKIYNPSFIGNTGDFVTIFFVIAWMKQNPENWLQRHWLTGLFATLVLMLFPLLARIVLPETILGMNFSGEGGGLFRLLILRLRERTILQILGALSVFYGFYRLQEKHDPLINTIAANAFGVYLWHFNYIFRESLWLDVFHANYCYQSSFLYPLLLIFGPIIVFTVASVIEELRRKVFDDFLYPRLPWHKKICEWLDARYHWVKDD